MSFSDTIFLFFLALILFGPKKLPEMARQAGRLLAELRRASNEFRSQIESEISNLEMEKKRTNLSSNPPPGSVVNVGSISTPAPISGDSLTEQSPLTTSAAAPAIPEAADASSGTSSEAVVSEHAPSDHVTSEHAESSPASQESHV